MPVVPIYLNIDQETYDAVRAGLLELGGLAKNIDNKRVAKHIPAVADAAKEGASNAIDFVREHKGATLIVGGIIVAGGAAAGIIGYISHREQRMLDKQFGNALHVYLDAARDGVLTLEILNNLISAMDAFEKNRPNQVLLLEISTSQFSELIQCIFNFTLQLAEAYNFSMQKINCPKIFKQKTSDDLKYYLNMQKQIFEQAA